MSLMSHNEARRSSKYWREKHQQVFAMIRFYVKIKNFPKNIHEQKVPMRCMIDDGLRQCVQLFFEVSMWPFPSFGRNTMGLKQFSVEDINTVLGIFLVNDFEINSSVGIMNVNMLYVWLLQLQHECACKYVKLAPITRCRTTLTLTMIMTMTSAYMQRCKDRIDYQVEDDVDMKPNSVSGLFPLGCILSHDCRANTVHTFESFEVSQSTCIDNELISMTVFNRKVSEWPCERKDLSRKGQRSRTTIRTLRSFSTTSAEISCNNTESILLNLKSLDHHACTFMLTSCLIKWLYS